MTGVQTCALPISVENIGIGIGVAIAIEVIGLQDPIAIAIPMPIPTAADHDGQPFHALGCAPKRTKKRTG